MYNAKRYDTMRYNEEKSVFTVYAINLLDKCVFDGIFVLQRTVIMSDIYIGLHFANTRHRVGNVTRCVEHLE